MQPIEPAKRQVVHDLGVVLDVVRVAFADDDRDRAQRRTVGADELALDRRFQHIVLDAGRPNERLHLDGGERRVRRGDCGLDPEQALQIHWIGALGRHQRVRARRQAEASACPDVARHAH